MAAPAPATVPDQRIGSWVFGSLLIVFYLAVFLFGPSVLPTYKYQMLGIISALLAGLFAYFLTGNIVTTVRGKASDASVGIRATGGMGLAIAMLLWWTYGPLHIQNPTQAAAQLDQQLQQAAADAGATAPAPVESPNQAKQSPAEPSSSSARAVRKPTSKRLVKISPAIRKLAKDLAASDSKYAAIAALQNTDTIPVEQLNGMRSTLAAAQTAK